MALLLYATGAALMVLLGPSPDRLGMMLAHADGQELTTQQRWALWAGQTLLWPGALVLHIRALLYRTPG